MKRSGSPLGVGILSVFTVLVVLTLAVFSALTLTSARSDLNLSQVNADFVTAYYAADSEAARLYAAFAAGGEPELDTCLVITETQVLHLHLVRRNGAVEILAWQSEAVQNEIPEEVPPPVWTGGAF